MNYLPLLAQTGALPEWLRELLEPEHLALLIPVCGIVAGLLIAITYAMIRHRERMAKIERGIDPDAKDEPK